MPNFFDKKKEIIKEVKTVTKDGECEITLKIELDINLNNLLDLQQQNKKSEEIVIEEKEKVEWSMPKFNSKQRIKMGE